MDTRTYLQFRKALEELEALKRTVDDLRLQMTALDGEAQRATAGLGSRLAHLEARTIGIEKSIESRKPGRPRKDSYAARS